MQSNQSSPRVHDAPAADRPRERLRSLGAPALRTAELLAILIRSGRPGESALQAGEKIAARFKDQLDRLAEAGRGELRAISPAIAETAYCQIMAGTFATLMLGGLGTLVQIGFALAFGVLLDTFIIRPFMVPAFTLMVWREEKSDAANQKPSDAAKLLPRPIPVSRLASLSQLEAPAVPRGRVA